MSEIRRVKLYSVLVALLNDGFSLEEIQKALQDLENYKILSRYSKYRNLLLNLADCDLALLEKTKNIISKQVLGDDFFEKGKRVSYEYVVLKLVLNFLESEKKRETE